MTQSLARAEPITQELAVRVFGSQERVDLIKEQIGRGWKEPMTDVELEHIAVMYQRNRLDPLAKPPQIHWIKRWDGRLGKEVMTGQLAIQGLRLIAQRSREWGGRLGPYWTADGKEWTDVWLSDEPPAAAKVGVRRKGFAEPVWSTATWREWAQYQKDSRGNRVLAPFWAAMPANMLAKTAEAHALTSAFPQETSDLEIAPVDQEWQSEQAQRYTEIFGADEDHSAYELPARRVDYETGEVIDAQSQAQELTGPERSSAVATTTPPATSSPSAAQDQPLLVDKYRRHAEVLRIAKEVGVTGIPLLPLKLGLADDVVEAAIKDLEDRIARAEWQQTEQQEVARQRAREGLK